MSTLHTYNIEHTEAFNTETRDFRPAFEVQHVRFSPAGDIRREVLATYTNRAAAELVVSALTAAQTDLT